LLLRQEGMELLAHLVVIVLLMSMRSIVLLIRLQRSNQIQRPLPQVC
jgi:hypothetical protein